MSRWLPENISTYGQDVDHLFYVIYYLTGFVFIGVAVAMLYFLFKYRDRGDGRRAIYSHGNNTLEVVWTTIPALIFLVLAITSESTWAEMKKPDHFPPADVTVQVYAHQFNWLFTYPGADGQWDAKQIKRGKPKKPRGSDDVELLDLLRVPVDKVVYLDLNSVDVIHSFFVPQLRLKQDTVPGRTITAWFEATQPGDYEIGCAELCGFGHTGMRAILRVLPQDEWNAWVAKKKALP